MLITRPHRRCPRANAYQSPSAAIHTPTSSPHVQPATRTESERKEAIRVEEPDAEEKQRDGQRQGMEPVHRHPGHPRVCEIRQREQGGVPLRAEVPAPEPQHGESTSATATICTATSVRGDGATIQKGVSAARIGSTCCPTRVNCSPVTPSVTSSTWPFALLQTAWVMFPRSYRASLKSSKRSRIAANSTTDQTSIATHTAMARHAAHGRHCGRGHALRRERRHPLTA